MDKTSDNETPVVIIQDPDTREILDKLDSFTNRIMWRMWLLGAVIVIATVLGQLI